MSTTAQPAQKKKSGLRTLKPGEVLFNDGAKAESLYIIQKGQLRLYKPKGKGFIEIAVLRAGEVIGEMAFFDDDGSGGTRSCAASAMVSTDIIEISFPAFEKTMSSLNPWFKTIINTLATRLRKANTRIRELESNSTSNYGKAGEYTFLKPHDIIKVLGTLFLIYRAHGEESVTGLSVHKKTIDLYAREIYGIMEAKLDTVIDILTKSGHMTIEMDENNIPKIFNCSNLGILRTVFIHYNTERYIPDDKKLQISDRCLTFLNAIWDLKQGEFPDQSQFIKIPIQGILDGFKAVKVGVGVDDLEDAKEQGIVGEAIVGDGNALDLEVNPGKLKKMLPIIKFVHAVKKLNSSKSNFR